MDERVERAGLLVAHSLASFVEEAALPGTGVSADQFWTGLSGLVHDLGPKNRVLLARREQLQSQIDDWHIAKAGQVHDAEDYVMFLREIGYIVPEGPDFAIETTNVDIEIAHIAGPQLVVPITNARFALNAANARWGSLYDALYGTDALGDLPPRGGGYDPARGARVVAWTRAHLDEIAPLVDASWADVTEIAVPGGELVIATPLGRTTFRDPVQFVGWAEADLGDWQVLIGVHGLLLEIIVDRSTVTGQADLAGISDIYVEAAVSAIMDCEDSVAAVDAADKVGAYANWLGLMKGDLTETFVKGGQQMTRRLNPDARYAFAGGGHLDVKCRALMLVRNVGHLMTTPAVHDRDGAEVGEGLLDAMITTMIAMHDLKRTEGPRNSTSGSVYVVKPKMHGPEEVAFAVQVFDRVEAALGLAQNTVKLGIMDEERRTSANLRECIRAAKSRIAFINTGFLDRTGDEIHTSMEAGPMLPKGEMKGTAWIRAYEDRNVDIGLACGLRGKAQIGKGMWAMPDRMADMLASKIAHPMAGANCAWVPSPTAAVLHATHYHRVDVSARQLALAESAPRASLEDLLTIPLALGRNFSVQDVEAEVDNNVQGILGYVVRWIDQGIGCSKVPDVHDVALMEDRATCRISAQSLANWLHHGVASEAQVMASLRKMSVIVDRQNADDPFYRPMAPDFAGIAFQAAVDLIFKGRIQPSGYTEPVLHRRRLEMKALSARL
jgi:malate synthase